ncbi:PKD domain-containing protein, partial [Spirochaetota bacterium]
SWWSVNFENNKDIYKQYMFRDHNFASLIAWGQICEFDMYEDPMDHKRFAAINNYYGKLTHEYDLNDRPYLWCSGPRGAKNFRDFDTTYGEVYQDIVSVHDYTGWFTADYVHYKDSLTWERDFQYELMGKPMSFLNGEFGGYFANRDHKVKEGIKTAYLSDPVDKKTIIDYLSGKSGYTYFLREQTLGGGMRPYWDDWYNETVRGRYYKRFIEEHRRLPFVKAWDICPGIIQFVHVYGDKRTDEYFWGGIFPTWHKPDIQLDDIAIRKSPFYHGLKLSQQGIFLMIEEPNMSLFAGDTYNADLLLINDTEFDTPSMRARIVLKNMSGTVYFDKTENIGVLLMNERRNFSFSWTSLSSMPGGEYTLYLYVHDNNGNAISENRYTLRMRTRSNINVNGTKNIALFDPKNNTAAVLDSKGVSYTKIDDFNNITEYDAVIVGKNSLREDAYQISGEVFNDYVSDGGFLLCLEHIETNRYVVPLAWPNTVYSIDCGNNGNDPSWKDWKDHGSFVQIIDYRHPAFEGLSQEDFDTWNCVNENAGPDDPEGEWGTIYQGAIFPLTTSCLGIGQSWLNNTIPKMTIFEESLGSGRYFHSHLDAVSRYNKDPIPTRYLNNILKYIQDVPLPARPATVPPVAQVNITGLTYGYAPLNVNFDASPSYDPDGSIVSYEWRFDDGTVLYGKQVSHAFTLSGIYFRNFHSNEQAQGVSLIITDDKGAKNYASIPVTVINRPPVPMISVSYGPSHLPMTVTLSADGMYDPDGLIRSVMWTFGDGSPYVYGKTKHAVDLTNMTHTYLHEGEYT